MKILTYSSRGNSFEENVAWKHSWKWSPENWPKLLDYEDLFNLPSSAWCSKCFEIYLRKPLIKYENGPRPNGLGSPFKCIIKYLDYFWACQNWPLAICWWIRLVEFPIWNFQECYFGFLRLQTCIRWHRNDSFGIRKFLPDLCRFYALQILLNILILLQHTVYALLWLPIKVMVF